MIDGAEVKRNFAEISKKLEEASKEIEKIIPRALIKETSTFGNSSHVVLSKNLVDKKVGVIVLGDKDD